MCVVRNRNYFPTLFRIICKHYLNPKMVEWTINQSFPTCLSFLLSLQRKFQVKVWKDGVWRCIEQASPSSFIPPMIYSYIHLILHFILGIPISTLKWWNLEFLSFYGSWGGCGIEVQVEVFESSTSTHSSSISTRSFSEKLQLPKVKPPQVFFSNFNVIPHGKRSSQRTSHFDLTILCRADKVLVCMGTPGKS